MGFRESRNLLFCSLERVASFLLGNVQWERASGSSWTTLHPEREHPLSAPLLRFPRACCLRQHWSAWGQKSAWRFTQDVVGYPMCPSDTCHRWCDGFLTWVLVAETQEIRLEAQRRTYAVGQEWIPSQHQGEGQANTPAVSWCIKFTPKY